MICWFMVSVKLCRDMWARVWTTTHPQCYKSVILIRNLVLTFDHWKQLNLAYFLLPKAGLCLKNSSKAKKTKKAKKGHQRPKLQKIIDFMDIQCKIINKWDCNTMKICFLKIWPLMAFFGLFGLFWPLMIFSG